MTKFFKRSHELAVSYRPGGSAVAVVAIAAGLATGLAGACKNRSDRDTARMAPEPPAAQPPAAQPEAKSEPPPAVSPPAGGGGEPTNFAFDTAQAGGLDPAFTSEVGEWKLEEMSGDGRVFVQRARNANPVFNVALATEPRATDVELSVRLRAISGEDDQGGGLVWRAADAKNYYIARWNPLEDNLRVYQIKDGKRTQIQSADVETDAKAWHTLRITMKGDHIEGYLDEKKLLDAHDQTFTAGGRVGLWTKADAVTTFDDMQVISRDGGAH